MSSEVINIPTAVALICVVVFAVMLIRTLVKIHRSGGCAPRVILLPRRTDVILKVRPVHRNGTEPRHHLLNPPLSHIFLFSEDAVLHGSGVLS